MQSRIVFKIEPLHNHDNVSENSLSAQRTYLFTCTATYLTSAFLCRFLDNMSRVVRKPAFCICENKDADQLRGLLISAFVFVIRIVQLHFLNPQFQASSHLWCMSDLVRNPEDRFSHNEAHMLSLSNFYI